jgi:hypothetical protein
VAALSAVPFWVFESARILVELIPVPTWSQDLIFIPISFPGLDFIDRDETKIFKGF